MADRRSYSQRDNPENSAGRNSSRRSASSSGASKNGRDRSRDAAGSSRSRSGSTRQSASSGRDRISSREAKRRRRKQVIVLRIIILILSLILLAIVAWSVSSLIKRSSAASRQKKAALEEQIAQEEARLAEKQDYIAQAAEIAKGYNYDGAIELLTSIPDYESEPDLIDEIARYTALKTTLVPVDVTDVPHIFYHSLIVDPERAFDETKWSADQIAGINAWMTTIPEFDAITQQMYDNGYVLVRLRDLVKETVDEEGNVHFTKNDQLLLPAGKKAYVLSIDDWSYYHSYTGQGFGDKAVLDENGEVKIQYTDAQGNVTVGDYDVVPRLNKFLEEHPDGAYKGARGLIAMTGYNGVFGYRTDVAYKTKERLDADQREWLDQHPDFNWDEEVAEAKKVAEAVKASGWEFACHTWGHLSVTGKGVGTLSTDQDKWQNTVANITGPTDTIIFAHGNDIGNWHDYDASSNEVYAYFKKMGYNFYCNVDASSRSWIQIRKDYVRQGRIDCDGLQMYRAMAGLAKKNVFEDLFDVNTVFDTVRPTPVSATGKS
ncbi:MAG: polysaccharide deacetylase [Lachnospiraceae bacterium]|nr:polysaccharide deacetylase [Lachnospiraceae bacterium]